MTERLHFHFPLSCIGEGNSNPLQCSCLENPMDGEAWWAAVYGVAQSRTRLKRLSSSSSTRPRSCQLSIVWERHDEGSLQGNVMRVSPYPLGHRTYIESETLYGMVLPVGRTHGFEDYGVKRDLFIITLRDPLCNPLYKPLCLNSRWFKDRVYHPQRRYSSLQDITLVQLNNLYLTGHCVYQVVLPRNPLYSQLQLSACFPENLSSDT